MLSRGDHTVCFGCQSKAAGGRPDCGLPPSHVSAAGQRTTPAADRAPKPVHGATPPYLANIDSGTVRAVLCWPPSGESGVRGNQDKASKGAHAYEKAMADAQTRSARPRQPGRSDPAELQGAWERRASQCQQQLHVGGDWLLLRRLGEVITTVRVAAGRPGRSEASTANTAGPWRRSRARLRGRRGPRRELTAARGSDLGQSAKGRPRGRPFCSPPPVRLRLTPPRPVVNIGDAPQMIDSARSAVSERGKGGRLESYVRWYAFAWTSYMRAYRPSSAMSSLCVPASTIRP